MSQTLIFMPAILRGKHFPRTEIMLNITMPINVCPQSLFKSWLDVYYSFLTKFQFDPFKYQSFFPKTIL